MSTAHSHQNSVKTHARWTKRDWQEGCPFDLLFQKGVLSQRKKEELIKRKNDEELTGYTFSPHINRSASAKMAARELVQVLFKIEGLTRKALLEVLVFVLDSACTTTEGLSQKVLASPDRKQRFGDTCCMLC